MKPRVTFHNLPGLPLMESGGFRQSQETWRPPAAGLRPRDSLMPPPPPLGSGRPFLFMADHRKCIGEFLSPRGL